IGGGNTLFFSPASVENIRLDGFFLTPSPNKGVRRVLCRPRYARGRWGGEQRGRTINGLPEFVKGKNVNRNTILCGGESQKTTNFAKLLHMGAATAPVCNSPRQLLGRCV